MKQPILTYALLLGGLMVACQSPKTQQTAPPTENAVLVIHGGASYPSPERNSPARDSAVVATMRQALLTGRALLKAGKSSTDAVVATIQVLEDSPYFNAGRGAVFSYDGVNELDASLMQGSDRKAGAVAAVTTIKNPIAAARLVMDSSDNVLMMGRGAEAFAASKNVPQVSRSYFYTPESWHELQQAKAAAGQPAPTRQKFGTVGCVALDLKGNLSAGTSTGGRTNKRWGRIGDSPIIGASTYADSRFCGVSSTGWGEHFIRNCTAHSVVAMMEYKGVSSREAADSVMYGKMKGIEGGIVVLDRAGRVSMPFNTPVMNRGYIGLEGEPKVFIYK